MNQTDPSKEHSHKSLGEILKTYFSIDLPDGDSSKEPANPPPVEKTRLLLYLRPIPWLLTALFVFSFYWDFDQVVVTIFSHDLMVSGLLRIVSISGLIGFLTNRIAIGMLFHPVRKRPILGHGLIPAHKDRIAIRLADSVAKDLINPELIRKKLSETGAIEVYRNRFLASFEEGLHREEFRSDFKVWLRSTLTGIINNPEFRNRISSAVSNEVQQSMDNKPIDKAAFKAYTFIRGRQIDDMVEDALHKLPERLTLDSGEIDEYLNQLPELLENSGESIDKIVTGILDKLIQQLNVRQIVQENINAYDERKLEAMIKGVTNEHLLTIQYLGAVLGTIGGFVIWQPLFSLTLISILAGMIILTDTLLDSMSRNRVT